MTIDERLERLTQGLELTAAENRERDRRLVEIMEGLARLVHVAEIPARPSRQKRTPWQQD